MRIRSKSKRALEDAATLVADGKVLEAIELLTIANRVRRDSEIECQLVKLRAEARRHLDFSRESAPWPPVVDDLFPNAVGPPEISRDELTPDTLRSGILHHGCLLVRGLVGEKRVHQLIEDIDRAFAAHDAHIDGTQGSTAPWYVPFEPGDLFPDGFPQRQFVRDAGGVLAADSPPTLFDIIETFEDVGIGELITAYLGEPPMLLAGKWTLRRVSPSERPRTDWDPEEGPDWHQDGAFMGADVRSVDVWLSLSHCGLDAPGLDIVARRFDGIVATGTDGAHFDWSAGHAMVEAVARGAIVRPIFSPGDALLFDHLLLHRTAIEPTMTKDRYAIEAWFAAPSAYPDDQVPIAY